MPTYEYICDKHGRFEEIKPMDRRGSARCPVCGKRADLVPSLCYHKEYNIFTEDGEGFSSVAYNPKEADIRAKHNLGKYEKV